MEYKEGAYSKVGNGWVKKGSMTDLEWVEFLANNGHSFFMHKLSGHLLISNTYPDKLVHAYKWAFLASMLSGRIWCGALDLLQSVLSQEEIDRGFQLAESWVEDRCKSELEIDKSGWAIELKEFFTSDPVKVGRSQPMRLKDRIDPALTQHILNSMTVGMKGELFASIILTDLKCAVENANSKSVNSRHVDLWVSHKQKKFAVQVKSTAKGSKGSFVSVNDSLIKEGEVKWFCIVTLDNVDNSLMSMVFVHVDELLRIGKRFPSNNMRCEVQHNVISSLKTYTASQWVSTVFE